MPTPDPISSPRASSPTPRLPSTSTVEFMPFELPGRAVHWFPSIDSTMTVAAQLAREGCPSGTVVVADQQTAGMGRHGRSWHSEPGAGLYVSVVLRLELSSDAI